MKEYYDKKVATFSQLFRKQVYIMSEEIVLQENIDSIYEEINTLIRQKKKNVNL